MEKLTIYTDKKNENILENIIIKDSFTRSKSKIIYAKKGYFSSNGLDNFLILSRGKILNISDGKTNSFDFEKTQINLSKYTSKSTKTPKLQEVGTKNLYNCLFRTKKVLAKTINELSNNLKFRCENTTSLKNKISRELFSRIFKPLYLPLLALIGGLLLIKSKNSQRYSNYKLQIFILGVIIISVSEISTKFYSINFEETFLILILPFILFFSLYYLFVKRFNLKIS